MYHFAIVALLGLAAYKTVELLLSLAGIELSRAIRSLVTLGAGVLFAVILDYSVFSGWGIGVRENWMGPVFTGLVVGAMSYVWQDVLAFLAGHGRGGRTDTAEVERPTSTRAA